MHYFKSIRLVYAATCLTVVMLMAGVASATVIDFSGGLGTYNAGYRPRSFSSNDFDNKIYDSVSQYSEDGFLVLSRVNYWGSYDVAIGDHSYLYTGSYENNSSLALGANITMFMFSDRRKFDLDSIVLMQAVQGQVYSPSGVRVEIPYTPYRSRAEAMITPVTFSDDFKNITYFTIHGNDSRVVLDDLTVSTTPEPSTMLLMGIGAAGAAFMRRRQRSK